MYFLMTRKLLYRPYKYFIHFGMKYFMYFNGFTKESLVKDNPRLMQGLC